MGNARARGTYDERVAQAGGRKRRSALTPMPVVSLPIKGFFEWLNTYRHKGLTAKQRSRKFKRVRLAARKRRSAEAK
jgi:hypothetical protein